MGVARSRSTSRLTFTATVAVLPEAEEVDLVIEDKGLRIDVYRASGPGGQSRPRRLEARGPASFEGGTRATSLYSCSSALGPGRVRGQGSAVADPAPPPKL